MKKPLARITCATLIAAMITGCAGATTQSVQTSAAQNEGAAGTGNAGSSTGTGEVASADSNEILDISQYTDNINLNYKEAIASGIYGWTLSEDGSYYMLSALNDDGTPKESTAKQSFMGGGRGGINNGGAPSGNGGQGGNGAQGGGGNADAAGARGNGGDGNAEAANNGGQKPDRAGNGAGGDVAGTRGNSDAGNGAQGGAGNGAQGGNGGAGNGVPGGNGGAGNGAPDGNGNGGAMNADDPLAMEQNQQAATASVNAEGVYTESNITNVEYQTMLVYVPAAYMTINEDGSASFTDTKIGSYTAETAPIVFQNSNGGWRSGSPKAPEYADALNAGMIYVSCGSRSRDAEAEDGTNTGKAPIPVADLKAGVIALRANATVIPGDKSKIISVGASGGGQMSSALGATGNMTEYYPYLYEAGAIGVTYDASTDTYKSAFDDSVYGAMAYCPIADIENADLAYAWLRYDSTLNADGSQSATAGNYAFSEFQLALQNDEAEAFGSYINSLGLVDSDGNALSFDANADGSINLRSGSFYDATLQNISDALNATLAVQSDPDAYISENYGDASAWLVKNADNTYDVTDLAAFINGTGLVRNKDIPGFDALDLSAENDAFGSSDTDAVHYSASVAKILQENYDTYKTMDGFDAAQIDLYIQNALTGTEAADIAEQTYLVNATAIMLNVAAGTQEADIAEHWRTRNGTADQHTSFSVAYDICVAASMAGADADYALVWAMGHGSNEGTTTGTFVDWINEICATE